MKIKRYIGNTTQEAMYKLRRELGPDTVILHTRKIKKPGIFGFFKKPLIEVVAALEENEKINIKNNNSRIQENSIKKSNDFKTIKEIENNMSQELKSLRNSIENLVKGAKPNNNDLPENLIPFHNTLMNNGIDEEISLEILKDINSRINIKDKDYKTINEIIKISIKDYLGDVEPTRLDKEQKIIFFVGPTGVGKTTTLAKIAANYVLNNNKKVGLITTDTYRIAAVEQLKTYSEILNLSLKIVYDIKEMYSALSNFKEKDIILIDTAGRNIKDDKLKKELNDLIETVINKDIYLVLSATTNMKILKSIVDEYSFIKNFKLIFTKTDEAENYGVLLNIKHYTDNSLSYLTNGQNVPEDIEIVNTDKIANILTEVLKYE